MLYISDFYILYMIAFFGAILAFIKGELPVGTILLIYSLAGIWVYLKTGTIRKALVALRKGNIQQAKRRISYVKFPQYLNAREKAYFHLIKGLIAYHENQFAEAFKHLDIALRSGFLSREERQLAQNIAESLQKTVM